jgi:hypothetical protein
MKEEHGNEGLGVSEQEGHSGLEAESATASRRSNDRLHLDAPLRRHVRNRFSALSTHVSCGWCCSGRRRNAEVGKGS